MNGKATDRARVDVRRRGVIGALLFGLALLLYGSLIVHRPIFTRGEAREAIVVQAMAEQGNVILPLRNGVDVPSKPPLFHWLALVASRLTGSLDAPAVRLPSVFAAAIAITAFFLLIVDHLSTRQTFLAVLILASSFEFVRNSSHARVDMCFTAAFSVAVYMLFLNMQLWFEERSYRWSYLLAIACAIAAAVLTKGPAALVLIGVIGFVFFGLVAGRDSFRLARELPWIPLLLTITLSFVLFGTWYLLAYSEQNSAFLKRQILAENIGRVVSTTGVRPGHEKPFYFAFIDLFTGLLPWSLFAPITVMYLLRQKENLCKETNRLQLFSVAWLGTFILAVSLSISKRPVYFLPAYPAAAILLAVSLDTQELRSRVSVFCNRGATLVVVLWAILLAIFSAMVVLLGGGLSWSNRLTSSIMSIPRADRILPIVQELSDYLLQHSAFFLAVLLLLPLLFVSARKLWRGDGQGYFALGLTGLATMCVGVVWIVNWDAQRKDPREFVAASKKVVADSTPLYAYQASVYPLRFYFGRNITEVGSLDDIVNGRGRFVIVPASLLPQLSRRLSSYNLLVRAQKLTERRNDHLLLLGLE